MNHDADIVEVSDPRDLTIDDPRQPDPHFQVVNGEPTVEELAALVAVLAGAGGGAAADPGPQELNPWGHPVDKLRYDVTSWQRVTLLERMHMRR
ncbi:acyl-CoA carboxylase epsilon subunit [Mycobacterium sp. ITM-2016-00317]|uniref:acyl-CoA carboxylase epsilon subunit n=1 Tax=Mycobacterium sp. ITM-2016-00317 TaxID=2099694 RepID=UPI000D4BC876|nr:acyl-CoA carboxylase epsilon subunit [Mycobacterium sp. ITM-2016-00317]WNG88947.1 acyl-CoA carboxylase epsilon subunit [Mycobacterium sp. ITM-2016-00317]